MVGPGTGGRAMDWPGKETMVTTNVTATAREAKRPGDHRAWAAEKLRLWRDKLGLPRGAGSRGPRCWCA